MKKIFITAITLLALNNLTNAGTVGTGLMNGSCSKPGLGCKGVSGYSIQKMQSGLTPLVVTVNSSTQTMVISIAEEDIQNTNEAAYDYFKTHNTLMVDEAATISPEAARQIGVPNGTTIPPGSYRISKSGDKFTITISMKDL